MASVKDIGQLDDLQLHNLYEELSKITRFKGAGKFTVLGHTWCGVQAILDWSVSISGASHTIDYLKCAKLFAVHDLTEAVIGDVPSPVKKLFGGADFNTMEDALLDIILGNLGIGVAGTPEEMEFVKFVDELSCVAEAAFTKTNTYNIVRQDFVHKYSSMAYDLEACEANMVGFLGHMYQTNLELIRDLVKLLG